VRKALIVGIDHYRHINALSGCVNDAYAVRQVLERNADGSINFATPRVMVSTSSADTVERSELREAVGDLFKDDAEIALFYFAGHGYIETTGGYLCAGDCKSGDDGLSLSDVMHFANNSKARNKVVVLDSCHSGVAGASRHLSNVAEVAEGVTILTASGANQYAVENSGGGGIFTDLFVDALNGAAANLVGDISPGSVYAHIDQSLGSWSQRPVFKTNVKSFVSLRKVQPPLPTDELRRIAELFPTAGFELKLDPTYEPERSVDDQKKPTLPPPDPAHTAIFRILQNYNRVNLLVPMGAPHMWHAAMQSKSCRLTALGEHYRRLVAEGLL
jgi:hypothetical protein